MRYQKVEAQIWNDEKFSVLPAPEKYLFLYLLTSPHSNCLGAFVMKPGYAADDMGWERGQYLEILGRLAAKGFVTVDETLSLTVVTNYLKHNPPENPNQFKAILKALASLPKSPALNPVILALQGFVKRFDKPLPDGFTEPFTKPETGTEAETETEIAAANLSQSEPTARAGEAADGKPGGEGEPEEKPAALPPPERMVVSEATHLMRTCLGRLQESPGQVTVLQEMCGRYPPECIRDAFKAAQAAGVQNLNWVRKRLEGDGARASPERSLAEEALEANRQAAREFCGMGG